MSQKATKVIVELYLRAVTCPGVFLSDKDDIYLSVSILGNYKQSECVAPVFPLFFREKMRFEKIFKQVSDPGAVAELLEYETVKFDLIQLIPPGGETLAYFEEDARTFLFPEPKLVPSSPGVDRRVLMTRALTFPGIAPRIEFSTRTTIFECSARSENFTNPNLPLKTVLKKMNNKKPRKSGGKEAGGSSAVRKRAPRGRERGAGRREEKPRSRSLSPSAISHRNTHRLAQLHLDTHKPKSSLRNSTPQVNGAPSTSRLTGGHSTDWALGPAEDEALSDDTDDLSDSMATLRQRCSLLELERASCRPDLRPFELSRNSLWEEIHERVRGLLTTSRAMHRLAQGATDSEIEDVLERRCVSPHS
ncbi:hypothetical protein MATL_G00196070 [Megalops atlanticus]|uniref:Spermatogenesis-associated protein 6 N-terminal domain-containing protein n=1 Tax=Megalops atlanticus TaxID=7932 RepID=A0A9D3PPB8_MEGAT|nr:hypothetical protein MATL_G00196070 [Megalops atlanticus]